MSVWNQIWAPPRPDNLKTGRDAIMRALAVGEKRSANAITSMRSPPSIPIMTGSTIARAPTPTWSRWSRSHNGIRTTPKLDLLRVIAARHRRDSTRHTGISSRPATSWNGNSGKTPEHPGPAHYIIHAYDYPALVDRALAAAQKYAVA